MTVQELFKDERLNISAIARDIGMNESLLRSYAKGLRIPSEKQIEKVQHAVERLQFDLTRVKLTRL